MNARRLGGCRQGLEPGFEEQDVQHEPSRSTRLPNGKRGKVSVGPDIGLDVPARGMPLERDSGATQRGSDFRRLNESRSHPWMPASGIGPGISEHASADKSGSRKRAVLLANFGRITGFLESCSLQFHSILRVGYT